MVLIGTVTSLFLATQPGTASAAALPATTAVPVPAALSFITPNLALTQAEAAIAALETSASSTAKTLLSIGSSVTATLEPALTTVLTDLSAAVKQTVADAAALNTAAVGADLTAAVSELETEVQGELSVLEGLGLSQGLSLAQQVVTPTCSLLATPTSLLGGLGLVLNQFSQVLAPIVQVNVTTDALITSTYNTLYSDIVKQLTSALGASGALLSVLEYTVHTTYYPPNGGTPIVRDTPALLDVPTPLDVDGSVGEDLCETLSVGSTGTIKQQISKMPLANPLLPVDVSSELLGGTINLAMNTHDSTVPINFTTSYSSANSVTTVDNTYSVQRGALLSLPPILSGLLGGLGGLTQQAPTPIVTQAVGIGATNAASVALRYVNVPGTSHVALSTSPATDLAYSANTTADSFGYALSAGTTVTGTTSAPAPATLDFCYSTSAGACSNAPAAELATDKGSLHLLASQSVKLDQYLKTATTGDGVSCTAVPVLDAHVTGSKLYLGQTPGTATASSGAIWADTGGTPLSGCVSMIGLNATLPTGFHATQRQAIYHTLPLTVNAKSGTVVCPTGTTLTLNLLTNLAPVLCPVPPAETVLPSIIGQAVVGSTVTAQNGTWTAAPNAPTFTYQWERCDASGASCGAISGATANTYTLPVGSPSSSSVDLGHTLRVVVTATNADGKASATSTQTSVVTLPPAPSLVTAPAITGTLGSGSTLTVSNGTWDNGVSSFAYQWTRCNRDGVTGCAPATGAGATTNSYVVSTADEGSTIKATVTVTNLGGTAHATSAQVTIPGVPTNTVPPVVQDGASVASGASVLAGDHLHATTGTWTDASSFGYEWQSCDTTGANCSDIMGATTSTYVVGNGDVGATLRVIVTGKNANQAPDNSAVADAAATGVVIANNQQLQPTTIVPDGTVDASAPGSNGTSYIGGSFDTVGPFAGGAAALSPSTAAVAHSAQALGGKVETVYADGSGGYFLGGAFTSVLGSPCAGLAHITSAGALDSSYCLTGLTGDVRALDQIGTLLAVGGSFSVGGHQNLVFVSPGGSFVGVTGGDPDGGVNAIADNGPTNNTYPVTSFYLGGDFTSVGGVADGHLAAVQPSGGTVGTVTWPAAVSCATTCSTPTVHAITEVSFSNGLLTYILVGGRFDQASGAASGTPPTVTQQPRHNVASFGAGTGAAVGAWNPSPDGEVRAIAVPSVTATTPSSVYLGGDFTHVGTTTVTAVSHVAEWGISSLEANSASAGTTATGAPATAWLPNVDGSVDAVTISGGNVYLGGAFTHVNGTTRHRIAAVGPAASTAPALLAFDPNAGQPVLALAHDATSVYAGGQFAVIGGTTRLNAAQLSPTTGLTSWNPAADGPVDAIAVNASGVWLGGSFAHVGGATRGDLALVDSTSGAALGSDSGLSGQIDAVASDGSGGVYVGGLFSGGGLSNLAEATSSGALAAWNPGVAGTVDAIDVADGVVYVGGSFASVGGSPRVNLAAVAPGSAAATSWNPNVGGVVDAIASNGSTVYVGGASGLSAFDPVTGAATGWAPSVSGAVDALVVLGNTVYAGGSFSGGGVTNLIGLDATDGSPTSFAPGTDGAVTTISVGPSGLLTVGGSFVSVGGVVAPNLAFFGG
jgi:hypothetical protein